MGSLSRVICALAGLIVGCGRSDGPAKMDGAVALATTDATSATPAPAPRPAPSGSVQVRRRLLAWVDPNAASLVFTRLSPRFDVSSLATLFALPPGLEKLLRKAVTVGEDLDAISALDSPPPSAWLAPEAVAMLPSVGLGHDNYVIRRITKPRAEVETILGRAGLQKSETEGFTLYASARRFPWKIVFLEDDVLGFIPATTVGSGLTPLTAGRDLPPSQTETEMAKTLDAEPEALLEMFAAGPIHHLDLGRDVAGIRFALRTWNQDGLDGAVVIQPVQDVEQAITQLEQRDVSFESDAVQAMTRRVAFQVSGPMIEGRLQMTANDVANVKKGS